MLYWIISSTYSKKNKCENWKLILVNAKSKRSKHEKKYIGFQIIRVANILWDCKYACLLFTILQEPPFHFHFHFRFEILVLNFVKTHILGTHKHNYVLKNIICMTKITRKIALLWLKNTMSFSQEFFFSQRKKSEKVWEEQRTYCTRFPV